MHFSKEGKRKHKTIFIIDKNVARQICIRIVAYLMGEL